MSKFRFIYLLITILYVFRVTELLIVSVGFFGGRYWDQGVNKLDCGLRYVPRDINRINYRQNCFRNRYKFQMAIDYSKPFSRTTDPVSKRIYKGQAVSNTIGPWVVYIGLVVTNPTNPSPVDILSFCSGSLITLQWVLTSATCVSRALREVKVVGFVVTAGSNKPFGDRKRTAQIKNMITHPRFTVNSDAYDIALIKLDQQFSRKRKDNKYYIINPICLPESGHKSSGQIENVTLFGFGRTIYYHHSNSWTTADMQLDDTNLYDNSFRMFIGSNSPAACPGDAGGPLVQYMDKHRYQAVLVGVTKYPRPRDIKCSANISINYFQAVAEHIDFILKTIDLFPD